jgi:hypothetical protein
MPFLHSQTESRNKESLLYQTRNKTPFALYLLRLKKAGVTVRVHSRGVNVNTFSLATSIFLVIMK